MPRHIVVDLMVPESLGGAGRRGARIPPHDKRTARKVAGLEATLIDNHRRAIAAFDEADTREFDVSVAGPSGLLVAKVFKIDDRVGDADRLSEKDALDVFRILRAVPTDDLARRFARLNGHELSREVTDVALDGLSRLFARPRDLGCQMAARAASPLIAEEEVSASAAALTQDLLRAV